MRNIKFKRDLEIEVYSSIDEMPIVNFQKYNKYLLIDSGIGSDVDSIDEHIVKIAKFISAGDKKNAMQELQNMRQNIQYVNNNISPKYLAFAALVHSVNGVEVTDYSDEGLAKIVERIKTVKHSKFVDVIEWIKKKVSFELETYFPTEFSSAKENKAFSLLKQRTLLQLDGIVTDNYNEAAITEIDKTMFSLFKPYNFDGPESIEVKHDKQFESMCLLIGQKASLDAKKMTVLQFYTSLSDINKQMKAESKAFNNHKH